MDIAGNSRHGTGHDLAVDIEDGKGDDLGLRKTRMRLSRELQSAAHRDVEDDRIRRLSFERFQRDARLAAGPRHVVSRPVALSCMSEGMPRLTGTAEHNANSPLHAQTTSSATLKMSSKSGQRSSIHQRIAAKPRSRIRASACARRRTLSFSRILCTWFLTVAKLTLRERAISLLESPWSTRRRISASRRVSARRSSPPLPDALLASASPKLSDAICCSSRAASRGEQCNSPRTALSTSFT